ncbi:uncharacterized protein LOC142590386 [Dermacentor variabilis]|uniref:uncharacterized protein LOC142590386 n=1 Tax=Dermacentor variabilis TaxID=34621 RepID=UPI003F5B579F
MLPKPPTSHFSMTASTSYNVHESLQPFISCDTVEPSMTPNTCSSLCRLTVKTEWAGVTECVPASLWRGPPLLSQPQRHLHSDGEEGSPLLPSSPHWWVMWVAGA